MCGIVGFLNARKNTSEYKMERGLFESMLYCDAIRGFDSTGMFWTKGDDTHVFKKAMPASDFLDLKPVDSILTKIETYDYIIGHNRWATSGNITNRNAHPFQIGDITLVHNGTLRNWKNLPGAGKIDVDSEAICNSINEIGAKATIEQLEGAFALVWHDAADNTLNLFSNDERPLHFGFIRKYDTKDPLDVVIASEYGMINWLAKRQGYDVKDIFKVNKGSLVTFHKNNLENYRVESIDLYVPPVVPQNNKGGSNAGNVSKFPAAEDNLYIRPYKLKFGQKIRLFMDEFETYQKDGNYGFICNWVPMGKSVDDIVEFRLNGMTKEESEKYINKYIEATISGAWKANNEDFVVIALSKTDVKILGEEDFGFRVVDNEKFLPANTKFKIFNNKEVDKITWERKTKQGCAWCGNVPEHKDAPDLVWESDEIFTCLDCASDREKDWAQKLN